MSITLEILEANFTNILEQTGSESYIPWQQFTKTSTSVMKAVDGLSKWLAILREMQHKNFIQTMKKLKSLDIPDSIQSVRKKKLPKQVLKPLLPRFKLENEKLQLVNTKEFLKEQALKQFNSYKTDNDALVKQLEKYIQYISLKAVEAGYKQNQVEVPQIKPFKSDIDFQFDDELFKKTAEKIKVNYLAGTKFVDLSTYNQIVDKTYDCCSKLYVELVQNARNEQRKNLQNHKVYFKLINDYLNNSEALLIQTEKKLYGALGLDSNQWIENQQTLLEKGMGQFMMMSQGGLRQKIKKSIPSKKEVATVDSIKIIKFQIKVIRQRKSDIKNILSELPKGLEAAQVVPVLLSLILNDYIYEAFGYQEEDFMKNMNGMQLYTNPELTESFSEMQGQIVKLMQQLGIIPEDLSSMMMGPQGDQMAKMMAEMSGMMNMGQQGGMNPMQMLQAQQAQLQQMFNQQNKKPQ